jgi:hypothetical protein
MPQVPDRIDQHLFASVLGGTKALSGDGCLESQD